MPAPRPSSSSVHKPRGLRVGFAFNVKRVKPRRLVPFDRLTVALVGEQQGGLRLLGPGEEEGRRPDFPPAEVDWAFRQPSSWCAGLTGPGLRTQKAPGTARSVAGVRSQALGCAPGWVTRARRTRRCACQP